MNKEQIEQRVTEYVARLPGTLLNRDATQDELNTAADIYRDGLHDGLERSQIKQLCDLLPTHIDLDNLDPNDFKDNSHRLEQAILLARQIMEFNKVK